MRSLIGLTLGFCALYASGAVVRVDTGVGVQGALDKVRSLRKSGAIDPQDGVTVLFAPDLYEGASPAPYLFLNGEMLKEARWPNEGYASFPNTNVVDHGGTEEKKEPYRPGAAFVLSEARARRWNVGEGVWLNGFWTHEWYSCAARVASFGAENGTNDILRLRPAVKYGVGNKAWGQLPYRRFVATDSLIENNEISDVVRDTSDAGAIYSGRNWQMQGNVIRNNYFHDFAGGAASPGGTSAVYLDDCVCGIAVEGNVFRNIHIGVKIGGGRENPVRHNLFVDCRTGISLDFRGKSWGGWTTHDPSGGWNLVDKCEALKYREGIWAKRYPQLADHMDDEPAAPFNDPLEHNVFLDCASPIGPTMTTR